VVAGVNVGSLVREPQSSGSGEERTRGADFREGKKKVMVCQQRSFWGMGQPGAAGGTERTGMRVEWHSGSSRVITRRDNNRGVLCHQSRHLFKEDLPRQRFLILYVHFTEQQTAWRFSTQSILRCSRYKILLSPPLDPVSSMQQVI
jgi:hypothetical protein